MTKNNRLSSFVLLVFCAACAKSPTTPSQPAPTPQPPPAAKLEMAGRMSIENCVFTGETFVCDFTAPARNAGAGCAANIRGVTKTYRPKPFDVVLATITWNYGTMVRANEAFTYRGSGAIVTQEDGWTYSTDFQFDSVACQ